MKAVYKSCKPCTTPLLTVECTTLLKEKNSIYERWREHFSNLLYRSSAVDTAVMDQIPKKPIMDSIDLPYLWMRSRKLSARLALLKLQVWPEIFKSAGLLTLKAFHNILTSIWEEENISKDFRDKATVSPLKNRGRKVNCGKYWGISLLSADRKILAHVILNHLANNI